MFYGLFTYLQLKREQTRHLDSKVVTVYFEWKLRIKTYITQHKKQNLEFYKYLLLCIIFDGDRVQIVLFY